MGWECGCSLPGCLWLRVCLEVAVRISDRAAVSSEISPGEGSTSTPPVGVAGFDSLQPLGLRPHFLAGFCPQPPSLPCLVSLSRTAHYVALSEWTKWEGQWPRREPAFCNIISKCTPSSSTAFCLLEVSHQVQPASRGGLHKGVTNRRQDHFSALRNCPPHCSCSILLAICDLFWLHSSFALCKPATIFILGEHRSKMGLLITQTVNHVIDEPLPPSSPWHFSWCVKPRFTYSSS